MSLPVPRVSVVMPFLNQERFLEEAIESVRAQTYDSWELLLVDDGSTDGSSAIAQRYCALDPERVRYFEHDNHANLGASASRNVAIRHARGEFIALLDGDDVWLPRKLEEQIPLLEAHPEAGSLFGRTLYWFSWTGNPQDANRDHTPRLGFISGGLLRPPELVTAMLEERAAVPCTCSLLVRRQLVLAVGGFDEDFRKVFTDQVFYAKLFLAAPVVVFTTCWDRYRQHDGSSVAAVENAGRLNEWRQRYITWLADYVGKQDISDVALKRALAKRIAESRNPVITSARRTIRRYQRAAFSIVRDAALRLSPVAKREAVRRFFQASHPKPMLVRFGSLRRTTPISRVWGRDRGRSLDRYYVEGFLERNASDVRGNVLEVGESTYTTRYGGPRVSRSDVLHVEEGNPEATVVADLTSAGHVADRSFDCIILTQTLQLIFDLPSAIGTLHRILKPGGVLLATVPGITHTGDADWQRLWHWSFTVNSAIRLFATSFGAEHVQVESHGNVLAATAFLYGLADHELRRDELDYHDPAYAVIITIRATRAAG